MVSRLSPISAISQARALAHGKNCYVVEKSTAKGLVWFLYRRPGQFKRRPSCLGRRSDAVAFFRFVSLICSTA